MEQIVPFSLDSGRQASKPETAMTLRKGKSFTFALDPTGNPVVVGGNPAKWRSKR